MNKKAKSILAVSFVFLATVICSILIYNLFVSAASNVPVGLHFEGNETINYDSDGIFSLNWTSGGGDAEANYTIWLSSDAGVIYGQYFNDSPTGYSITGGVDAENYTFKIQAVNATGNETENVSSGWMFVDLTDPTVQFVEPTNAAGNYTQNYIEVNVTAADSGSGLDTITIYLFRQAGFIWNSYATNNSLSSPYSINYTNLNDGTYRINATANDTAGNINQTETKEFLLDITPPRVTPNPTTYPGAVQWAKEGDNVTLNVSIVGTRLWSKERHSSIRKCLCTRKCYLNISRF